MTSIRIRLLIGFFGIIALMGVVGAAIIVSSSSIQRETQRYDDALYLEFGLTGRAETLLRAFHVFRSAPSEDRDDAYATARATLLADMTRIESVATAGIPRPAISGIHSTIAALIAATDDGMDGVRSKNLSRTDDALDRSGHIRTFVSENVATVVLEELEVSRAARTAADRLNFLVLAVGAVVLAVTGVASAAYGLILARRISTPLTQLTAAAGQIAGGSYDVTIDEHLLRSTDEVGSLARSFNAMAVSLRTTIGGLETARHELESKNTTLEKLNHLFMSREGRIAELKKEIVHLGGTTADKGIDTATTP